MFTVIKDEHYLKQYYVMVIRGQHLLFVKVQEQQDSVLCLLSHFHPVFCNGHKCQISNISNHHTVHTR